MAVISSELQSLRDANLELQRKISALEEKTIRQASKILFLERTIESAQRQLIALIRASNEMQTKIIELEVVIQHLSHTFILLNQTNRDIF